MTNNKRSNMILEIYTWCNSLTEADWTTLFTGLGEYIDPEDPRYKEKNDLEYSGGFSYLYFFFTNQGKLLRVCRSDDPSLSHPDSSSHLIRFATDLYPRFVHGGKNAFFESLEEDIYNRLL